MNDSSYNYAPAPKRQFSASECVFAWICFIAAYLFCRAFPGSSHPLGAFTLVVCMYITSVVFMKLKGARFELLPTLLALSSIVICGSMLICDNPMIMNLTLLYAVVTYCYFVYSCFGNRLKKGFSDLIFIDFFKVLFLVPFCSFSDLFKAVFTSRSKSGGRTMGKLFLGIAIAILPTITVLSLLSYDEGFRDILRQLFDFSIADIISHFITFHFAVPLGALCFGLFISSIDKKCEYMITAKEASSVATKMKIAPLSTVLAATLPVLGVYVIFFISQFGYYASGFTGVLPESFSYADYAREGFFQLCEVSLINLAILTLVMCLSKKTSKAQSIVIKLLCVIYSVATLILIATCISKMFMYINCYGLTPKRVYAAWLEIVLALIFLLIILKQFIPKLNIIITSFIVVVICFGALALSGIGGRIAEYNVSRYLDGTLDSVDTKALDELGYEAVPEMIKLYNSIISDENWYSSDEKGKIIYDLHESLYFTKARINRLNEKGDIFSYNLPVLKAKQAIENTDIKLDKLRPEIG